MICETGMAEVEVDVPGYPHVRRVKKEWGYEKSRVNGKKERD